MYVRGVRSNNQRWNLLFQRFNHYVSSGYRTCSLTQSSSVTQIPLDCNALGSVIGSALLDTSKSIQTASQRGNIRLLRSSPASWRWTHLRYFSSKGDGGDASEDKHVHTRDGKSGQDVRHSDAHTQLGEQEQKEWLRNEKLSLESKKKESPFLSRRERFKNEFLRRVVPWERIALSWDTFPYYIHEHTKNVLMECVASHLKHKKVTVAYGGRLSSSSGRILLQSIPGDRVKYTGPSGVVKADNRILLGKIPTSGGPTNAYTIIRGRSMSSGQRGEIYEVNGDQVAVIFDVSEKQTLEEETDEKPKAQDVKPSIYWIPANEIEHDLDAQAEGCYIAMEVLCEVLKSAQPIIVYFPDSSLWLSRAVSKANRKEFVHKVQEMFDQLTGPVVLICGRNKVETGSKEKEKFTMILPNLGRLAKLPLSLKRLTEGLRATKRSVDDEIHKLFSNIMSIHPPKEEDLLRTFNKQIEEDRRIVIARSNLNELYKVLEEHELSCIDLLHVNTDDVILTKQIVPQGEIGVKFDDIGALEEVKKALNELVILPMRRPELFSRGNLLRPCKGILLFGPPGTGKTLVAKALATEAGANFISITGSTLTSKWFGDAEKLTKALFSFASKLAPVIIFVDEVDSLLGARGGSFEHEATRRMRNEFMAAWDGLRSKENQRILILGATNRPFDLDDAVIRRLPRRIYVDLPDAANRLKILKIILARENLEFEFPYENLANATEGYSGSDLKNLCIAAAYRPVQEILEEEKELESLGSRNDGIPVLRPLTVDDFIQSKAKVGPSVAYDAASMNELRKWNDQYGEGGTRRKSPFGF
ncbi:unnamed protein product [Withania somnifera]